MYALKRARTPCGYRCANARTRGRRPRGDVVARERAWCARRARHTAASLTRARTHGAFFFAPRVSFARTRSRMFAQTIGVAPARVAGGVTPARRAREGLRVARANALGDARGVFATNAFYANAVTTTRDVRAGAARRQTVMAAKVAGYIKLALQAGKATPAPPVGPALGAKVREMMRGNAFVEMEGSGAKEDDRGRGRGRASCGRGWRKT